MEPKMTPMIKQYLDIKKKYPEEILFFRMGDFYEMFFEDAKIASRILDIALTSRQNDIPMCGIPYHASESYTARLIKAGKRVAVCEQLEKVPTTGTIVRREVVRIITPGTIVEQNLMHGDENNFLASVIIDKEKIGLAFVDVSTGDFSVRSIDRSIDIFRGEIVRHSPREVVLKSDGGTDDDPFTDYVKNSGIPIYKISGWLYDTEYMSGLISDTFKIAGTKGLGITSPIEIAAAGSAIQYLKETHAKAIENLKYPVRVSSGSCMTLDDATIKNLELVRNQNDLSRERTLLSVLDRTKTPMGKRLLETNILQPLSSIADIEERLSTVQFFHQYTELRSSVQEILKSIHDLERIVSRLIAGRGNPKHYISLRQSIDGAARVKQILEEGSAGILSPLIEKIPVLDRLSEIIYDTVDPDPAMSPETGRVIRKGFNAEIDRLYDIKHNSKKWILEYQESEKARLGLSTLKIKYNRVLGYYIEVSRNQSVQIPADYLRKQTLVGAERYTTEKLQEFEGDILSASDKIIDLENAEIEKLNHAIISRKEDISSCASSVAEIDFFCSLASSAYEGGYVRPEITEDGPILIIDGRHPIVEKYYTKEIFIPNDVMLDTDENMIKIITGPNMSGKSTYIRMSAIVTLMAHIGSFVPAKSAKISITDRIFTRIGASDNISRGESTFLVEMNETAVILNNATTCSLIIMDEIGRGTSTYDGLSIAWAVVEYILRYIKAKTLFATHYHELTKLGTKRGIVNYTVMVKEDISGIQFLHKLVQGSADRSYGIHVAQLAGIPRQIISRAGALLEKLEKGDTGRKGLNSEGDESDSEEQLEIFNATNHLIMQTLKDLDIEKISPLEALNRLSDIKKLL